MQRQHNSKRMHPWVYTRVKTGNFTKNQEFPDEPECSTLIAVKNFIFALTVYLPV